MVNVSNTGWSVRTAIAAAMMIVAASTAMIGEALALDRNILVTNDTSVPLLRFYASNVGMETWGTDHLGQYILDPGKSLSVDLDDGSGYCMFDIRGEFADGTVKEDFQVSVCEISRFTYYE